MGEGHKVLYIIGSDDVAEEVIEEDKFKYVDDLYALEALIDKQNLIEYDFSPHVASEIEVGNFLAHLKHRRQIIKYQDGRKKII